jgi:TRAP-type transport system small permease protein
VRVLEPFEKLLGATVAVLTLTTVVVIVVQVFFRYVLGDPLIWTEELARYVGTWGMLLAVPLVQKVDGHVALEMFPERFNHLIKTFANVAMLGFAVVLIRPSIQFALVSKGVRSAALRIPSWALYAAMPVTLSLVAVYSGLNIARHIRALRSGR